MEKQTFAPAKCEASISRHANSFPSNTNRNTPNIHPLHGTVNARPLGEAGDLCDASVQWQLIFPLNIKHNTSFNRQLRSNMNARPLDEAGDLCDASARNLGGADVKQHWTFLHQSLRALFAALLFILSFSCKRNLQSTTPTLTEPSTNGTNNAEAALNATAAAAPIHTWSVIFNGGSEGYHSYRIPSIVRTNSGTLIAFAEGRMSSNKDYGNINLVYKRSTNNGSTWSSLGEVVGVGPGTWGNPTAVVDRNTGRVWLFLSWNDGTHNQSGTDGYEPIDSWGERKVYVSWSDNDGVSWATPVDLTNSLLPPNFTWDAMGPGVGLQTSISHPGRLIIPASRRNIYSDDHGATWHYQMVPDGSGEPTIIELIDGKLMRNDRPGTQQFTVAKRRWLSTGTIENGFSAFAPHNTLLDPKCEASVLRYTGEPSRIMFLNPASTERRCKMRIRISYDEGATWPISRRTHDWLSDDETCNQGKGGYSSMTKTADYCVGALIEINEDVSNNDSSHRSIEFHKFNLPWILNGTTEPLP